MKVNPKDLDEAKKMFDDILDACEKAQNSMWIPGCIAKVLAVATANNKYDVRIDLRDSKIIIESLGECDVDMQDILFIKKLERECGVTCKFIEGSMVVMNKEETEGGD